MDTRIGTCSLCGGDVYGYTGPWWGTVPPPPPTCRNCGSIPKWADDTIDMSPRKLPKIHTYPTDKIEIDWKNTHYYDSTKIKITC